MGILDDMGASKLSAKVLTLFFSHSTWLPFTSTIWKRTAWTLHLTSTLT